MQKETTMKDICVWAICLCTAIFGLCYDYQIWRRKAVATTSTWLIFLVGSGLSLITYFIAENKDWKSGILNMADVINITIVLTVILLCTDHKVRFKPFEKWYLVGAGLIVLYGVVTGDAWRSNVLTQVLMSVAYLPMFHKLFVEKRKTDSYFAWAPQIFIAVTALYPAIHEGNSLAVIYASRSLFFAISTTLLMRYYQINARKAAPALP